MMKKYLGLACLFAAAETMVSAAVYSLQHSHLTQTQVFLEPQEWPWFWPSLPIAALITVAFYLSVERGPKWPPSYGRKP